jgi:hypothetical protein
MDDENRTFHLYVDETSKSANYFGVGAIFCRRDAAKEMSTEISAALVAHGQRPDKELHWTDLKKHLLPLYTFVGTKVISYTQKPKKMRFRAIMVESKHINWKVDPKANREDTFAKFIFTLVYAFAKDFGPNIKYHVFIDSPDGSEEPSSKTRAMLNNRCKSQLGYIEPFKTVKYVRSENSRMIQATDLIVGAVAYETNAHHQALSAATHRRELWSSMLTASNLTTFAAPTRIWPKTFQIGHFDFKKSKLTRFARTSTQ